MKKENFQEMTSVLQRAVNDRYDRREDSGYDYEAMV
jgi:hypothetical protein